MAFQLESLAISALHCLTPLLGLARQFSWEFLPALSTTEVIWLQGMRTIFLKMCTHAWHMEGGPSKRLASSKRCFQQTGYKALVEPRLLLRQHLQLSFLPLV